MVKTKLWSGKRKQLSLHQSIQLKLKSDKINLYLGSLDNHLVIQALSPWHNFAGKDNFLTQKAYIFDPSLYDPKKLSQFGKKLLGDTENIILGSIRNNFYFGASHEFTKSLAPEHLLVTIAKDVISLTSLTIQKTTITRSKKRT